MADNMEDIFVRLNETIKTQQQIINSIANKIEQIESIGGGGGGSASIEDYESNKLYTRNILVVDTETETVYRVYEKDGWKRIDFNDIKIQIIDGEYKRIAFQFTADSLKNDKSLESGIFVKNPQKVDETNGYLIKNLKASSTLTDKYHTYSADGMLKVYAKNPNSENLYYQQASAPKFWVRDNIPWVEGKTGDGIGEYIEFDLYPSTDYRHDKYRIRILNGYVNPLLPHLFKENNRIKTATVETDKGYKDTISFEDVVEFTDFFIPMKKDGPTHVKITIDEVYKGSKYSDTSITALEANYQLWEK